MLDDSELWQVDSIEALIETSPKKPETQPPYDGIELLFEEGTLPDLLEPFFWGFKPYRCFIESTIDWETPLNSEWIDELYRVGKNGSVKLAEALNLNQDKKDQLASLWTRFRSEALKKRGGTPLQAI